MDKAAIKTIAQQVVDQLKAAGFKVQLYEAPTQSIYLWLDYGMCNSIRISDHKGKKSTQYRYNLLSHFNGVHRSRTKKGFERCFYGFDNMDALIEDIMRARGKKLRNYGRHLYGELMQQSFEKHRFEVGFWAQCVEV